jgi:glycosyltransferase involved in cell wall biosynthesis
VPSKHIVFASQVYPPDPTSVGQHVADAARELARRGHHVRVLTADRGYDDPSVRHAPREREAGVEIRRLPLSSFGKRSLRVRMLAGAIFTIQAALRLLLARDLDTVVVTTVPPMAALATLALARRRRVRVVFWVMDLNPDQAIALGALPPQSLPVRLLGWGLRGVLRRADDVVVLDPAMEARVRAKVDVDGKVRVLPPWPLEDHLEAVSHDANPFRGEQAKTGQFVVMYSGNHSPANPIDTLLAAARALRDDDRFLFLFVGGGSEKAKVERCGLPNVRSLPYQPLETLRYSLSAADLHVVTMGDAVLGIVHPCKIYGAMAVARPVLAVAPATSHIVDLVDRYRLGWHVRQGDVAAAVAALVAAVDTPPAARQAMGRRGQEALRDGLAKAMLCPRFCDVVDGSRRADDRVPEIR